MCFARAGDAFWEKSAEAAELRAVALSMSGSNSKMTDTYLKRAAEIFVSICKYEQAAQCYYESKDYEKAGLYFLMMHRKILWFFNIISASWVHVFLCNIVSILTLCISVVLKGF